ncbi:unnamed protein product [Ambrosiozyma monospora]|uniref:Unnamed protein product n=1 Tax=Ambrosiozyma monospora TaxID=43982 RepID=A0ACB5TB13_AMBMO|nr:unnamed protein product [Ambrosiozyma monospora]
MTENRSIFDRIRFIPQIPTGTKSEKPDLSTLFFPQQIKFDAPFYITAFAGSRAAHEQAEYNLVNAAYTENVPYMIPIRLSVSPVRDFAKICAERDQFSMNQIYFDSRDQVDQFPQFLKSVEEDKEVLDKVLKFVCITVDSATTGNRERDYRSRVTGDNDEDVLDINTNKVRNMVTWDDIIKFRDASHVPIVLKGVQCKEDIVKAMKLGLGGVVISNHGGRQLDYAQSSVEVLADTVKYCHERGLTLDKSNFSIFVDGGFRSGSDIVKALCLGASGVGLGRPFLYSMASYGQPGVEKAIQILKTEIEQELKLLGVGSVDELNESFVDLSSLKLKNVPASDNDFDRNYIPIPHPQFYR